MNSPFYVSSFPNRTHHRRCLSVSKAEDFFEKLEARHEKLDFDDFTTLRIMFPP